MEKTLLERTIAIFRGSCSNKGERLDRNNHFYNFAKKQIKGRYFFARKFVKNKKVLDIACGDGYGTSIIAQIAKQVIGVDYDESTIRMNNSTYKKTNVEFRVGDGNNIKIKDKFDTVISFETIEHLKEGQKFIHSLYNLLNKNGTLVLSTPDHKFKDLFFGGKILMKYHLKEYYQEEMAELLKKVGFQEIQIYYYHIAAKKFKYLSFIYFFLKRGFKVLPKTKKVVPINMIFVARKK